MNITVISHLESPENLNRGLLYGDGFFTTGLFENQQIRHKDAHYQRLSAAAHHFRFEHLNLDKLFACFQANIVNFERGCFRITCYREQQERGYQVSKHATSQVLIQLSPWVDSLTQPMSLIDSQIAVSVNPHLAGFKHLNRLDSVLASRQLSSLNQEVIMYAGDNVISGSKSNLFFYLDHQWVTPSILSAGVLGITRARLMRSMLAHNISVKEAQLKRSDLSRVQSALVTNAVMGMRLVNQINNKALDTQIAVDLQSTLNFKR
ncbi:aminotransferase class IV [Aliikangiella sp. IMCC44653]